MALKTFSILALGLSLVSAAPNSRTVNITIEHEGPLEPFIPRADFPDPGVLQAEDGSWVTVASNGQGKMPYATAKDMLGNWTMGDHDLWPGNGWTDGEEIWAPDLRRLDNGEYIIYFAGHDASQPNKPHCIGTLRSKSITGPYKHDNRPWFCPPKGWNRVIDPAGFKDSKDGRRYVVYKQEGDTPGPTGGNALFLQEVEQDGSTMVGKAVLLLDRIESDLESLEAPNIVRLKNGMYVLFFSTGHFMNDNTYDVKYAYAADVAGPYTRAPGSLIKAPMLGLRAPGGATSNEAGDKLLFHGWCVDHTWRCFYGVPYKVNSSPCKP